MSKIKTKCSNCGESFKVLQIKVGKEVTCPVCDTRFVVTQPESKGISQKILLSIIVILVLILSVALFSLNDKHTSKQAEKEGSRVDDVEVPLTLEKMVEIGGKNLKYLKKYDGLWHTRKETETGFTHGKVYTGYVYALSDSGYMTLASFCKNGEIIGNGYTFFPDGSIDSKTKYLLGKEHGEYKSFTPKGELSGEGNYFHGRRVGEWRSFYFSADATTRRYMDTKTKSADLSKEQIKLIREKISQMEAVEKLKKIIEPSLAKIENYVDGELDGLSHSYYPSGLDEVIAHYYKGELHGEYQSYYVTGGLKEKSIYVNGKKEGLSTEYYSNGKIKSEKVHKKNDKFQAVVEYSKLGEFTRVARLNAEGKFEGELRFLSKNVRISGKINNGYFSGSVNYEKGNSYFVGAMSVRNFKMPQLQNGFNNATFEKIGRQVTEEKMKRLREETAREEREKRIAREKRLEAERLAERKRLVAERIAEEKRQEALRKKILELQTELKSHQNDAVIAKKEMKDLLRRCKEESRIVSVREWTAEKEKWVRRFAPIRVGDHINARSIRGDSISGTFKGIRGLYILVDYREVNKSDFPLITKRASERELEKYLETKEKEARSRIYNRKLRELKKGVEYRTLIKERREIIKLMKQTKQEIKDLRSRQ